MLGRSRSQGYPYSDDVTLTVLGSPKLCPYVSDWYCPALDTSQVHVVRLKRRIPEFGSRGLLSLSFLGARLVVSGFVSRGGHVSMCLQGEDLDSSEGRICMVEVSHRITRIPTLYAH